MRRIGLAVVLAVSLLAPVAEGQQTGQVYMIGRVWHQRRIRTAFENAVENAKLDDFRFHDTRHHFASWFMMRGGGLQALKGLLGHADIKTTLIYAHLSPAHLRSEVARTEPRAEHASISAQSSAQEVAELEGVSSK